jgi:hypothetical protein
MDELCRVRAACQLSGVCARLLAGDRTVVVSQNAPPTLHSGVWYSGTL